MSLVILGKKSLHSVQEALPLLSVPSGQYMHVIGKCSTQFLAFYLKIISCDGVVIYARMDTHKEVRKNIGVLLSLYLPISLETGALGEASTHHFG